MTTHNLRVITKKILIAILFLVSFNVMGLNPSDFLITRVTAPYFVVDGNNPSVYNKAYVGFEVKNISSLTTYHKLRFTIPSLLSSITGQNYTLISPADGITNIGNLAPGESRVCYYYVSYPTAQSNAPQAQATFNVKVSDTTVTEKLQSFNIYNRASISANAGGLTRAAINNQDLLGGIITDTITYTVGNVRNGDENDFQVAVSSGFDPAKLTLLSTTVLKSDVPNINIGSTDSLYFISGNGSVGASVTILWKFRISAFGFNAYLLPCAGATSGNTNYKYAFNSDLNLGVPVSVSPTANQFFITKTSNKSTYCSLTDSVAVFTITINNSGAFDASFDKIFDTLPTGFSFQGFASNSQITSNNSVIVPTIGSTGQLNFEGGVSSGTIISYFVPAGGSLKLVYNASIPSINYTNLIFGASAFLSTTVIGYVTDTVSVNCILQPVAIDDAASTNEDNTLNGTVATNDIPTINVINLWSIVTNPSHGLLVLNSDGSFAYTPFSNYNGIDSFTYKICNSNAECDTALMVITINSINDLPIAVNDAITINEDTPTSGNVYANDTQSGDGGNNWTLVTGPTRGTIVFNLNGTYSYTPNPNYNGKDSIYYKLCDSNGDCSIAKLIITIKSVNDLPVTLNDNFQTDEDVLLNGNVSLNDTLSGDGGNNWSLVRSTLHGSLSFTNSGVFTYIPLPDYNGVDSFYYKLCDANGDCRTSVVIINIVPTNDFPIAFDNINSTNQNTPVSGEVSSNDTPSPDGGNVWSLVSTTSNGTLVFNADGTYLYTPNLNFSDVDTFYYNLCDIDGDCVTAMTIIAVDAVLPVNLISFTAIQNSPRKVELNWVVTEELNINHYEIERSEDGYHFDFIASVNIIDNNSSTKYYNYINDLNIASSSIYYRLKIVDNNGRVSFSKIILIKIAYFNSQVKFIVYPNPFNTEFKLSIISPVKTKGVLRMIAMDGKKIFEENLCLVEGNNLKIVQGLSRFQKGVYLIELAIGDVIYNTRVVKK